jgi:DNA-binding response OmpR family regulator
MEKKLVLVVDDEQDLCEILHFNLTAVGYDAEVAYSADEAFTLIHNSGRKGYDYDLLLVDVMMPGMSGFQMAEKLKQDQLTARVPIIFLTAKDTEEDKLQGFGIGADDYVTKPFSVREVMARVRAVLNRSTAQPAHAAELLRYEGLEVNRIQKTAAVDGQEVALTKTEYELLSLLLIHSGHVLSRQQLLDGAWPHDVVVTGRTVDVNIARLRKKIGRYANNIVARQGFGYYFEVKSRVGVEAGEPPAFQK